MNSGKPHPPLATPNNHGTQRVILLGASNLARGFPTIVHLLRQGLAGPLDIAVAMGHGRSYGTWSRWLGRALPGINHCGLWPYLANQSLKQPAPLAAIMDLGNDLVYGVDAKTLLGWLDTTLQRLRAMGCDVVMLSLPMESLDRLTSARFEITRRLIFPGHPMGWPELHRQIRQLDEVMRGLARQHGVHWIEAPGHWFGMDPIHIRRSLQAEAWQTLFGHWPVWKTPAEDTPPALWQPFELRLLQPAERRLFGMQQRAAQPALSTPGFRISLF